MKSIALWLNSKGYDLDLEDDFWMEHFVSEHKWRDVIELINDYADEHVPKEQLLGNPCKHYKYGHDCSQENEFHCGKKPCTIDFGEAYE